MTDRDPASAATDSPDAIDAAALAEFQRKAGPIVALERGLTPAARLKLADVARQLGLSDGQFEVALRSLSPTSPSPAASKAAERFRRRLLKDLQPKAGGILGPKHETQILEAARDKYSLDDVTALDQLARVTAELGIHRVRGDDALRNLADAVQDSLGDQTWIAQDTRDRLHVAARQWGLDHATVDSYIEDHLATNRALAARSVRLSRAIYAIVGLLAVFVVVALVLLFSGRGVEPAVTQNAPSAASGPANTATEVAAPPKWWTVELAVSADEAKKRIDGFPSLLPDLFANDVNRRGKAYGRLVGLVARVPPDPQHLSMVKTILRNAYAAEPDDAAAVAIGDSLLSHLPRTESPLPKHSAAYDLAYWATETAMAAATNPKASPERRNELLAALSSQIAEPLPPDLSPAEQTQKALGGLSRAAMRHLISRASESPDEVAGLHAAVHAHAAGHLEFYELQRLDAELVLAAFSAKGDDAKPFDPASLRPVILDLAASTDPQVTIALVDLYERMPPSALRDELQSLLLLRLKVTNAPQSPRAIARAMRRALGVTPTGSQAVERRWELLRSRAADALDREMPPADDVAGQLTDAVEFAWLATQALALAQGETGLPIYEELVALYPDEPFALKFEGKEGESLPSPMVSGGSLSASEQESLGRYLTLLADRSSNPIQRESSLRGLALLAPKLDDLRPAQARQLASYLLHPKADSEQAEAVAAAGALRRWKQLRMAVADAIGSSTLPPEQQTAIVDALLGRPSFDADPADWPRLLLESVLQDLQPSGATPQALRAEQRKALEASAAALVEIYRVRARLLGVLPTEYQTASLPAQVLEPIARQMMTRAAAVRSSQPPIATAEFTGWPVLLVDRWPKELTVVDYLSANDLARTVLLEELALKLSAAVVRSERPERSEAALRQLQESRSHLAASRSLPEQLRSAEADLLTLWLLMSPSED